MPTHSSSKKFEAPPKVNATLPNIANLPQEDKKSEDKEMQSLYLPQGQ